MKRFLLTLLVALASFATSAFAQTDNLISNPDAMAFTPYGTAGKLQPDNWYCANYPARAAACTYKPGALGIVSGPMGSTVTARMAWPIVPSWTQSVPTLPGTHTLTVTVTKRYHTAAYATNEHALQAAVVQINGVEVLRIPHSQLTLDVPETRTIPVNVGYTSAQVKLMRGYVLPYNTYGFRYDFAPIVLTRD